MFFGNEVKDDYTEVPISAIKIFNKSRNPYLPYRLTKADQDIYIYLLRGKSKPIKSNKKIGYGRRRKRIGSYYDVTRHYKTISKNTGYSTHTISESIMRLEEWGLIFTDGRKSEAICSWEGRDEMSPKYIIRDKYFRECEDCEQNEIKEEEQPDFDFDDDDEANYNDSPDYVRCKYFRWVTTRKTYIRIKGFRKSGFVKISNKFLDYILSKPLLGRNLLWHLIIAEVVRESKTGKRNTKKVSLSLLHRMYGYDRKWITEWIKKFVEEGIIEKKIVDFYANEITFTHKFPEELNEPDATPIYEPDATGIVNPTPQGG